MVVNDGIKLELVKEYSQYYMHFRYLNIKEAAIFVALSDCQIFFTISR